MTRREKLALPVPLYRSVEGTLEALTRLVFPPGLAVALPDGRRGQVVGHGHGTERPRVAVKLAKAASDGNGWVHAFPTIEDLLAANPHLGGEAAEDAE